MDGYRGGTALPDRTMTDSHECPECGARLKHRTFQFDSTPSNPDRPVVVAEGMDGEPITVRYTDLPADGRKVDVSSGPEVVQVGREDLEIAPAGPTEEYECLTHGLVSPA